MDRAIITGATGMIGIALIEECVKQGVSVVAITRPQSVKKSLLPESDLISIVECELSEYDILADLVPKGNGVFYHFAWGATGIQRNVSVEYQCENIKYTLYALKAAGLIGCSKFIGAGSQAEYGYISDGRIGAETTVNPNTPYGISKYAAGKLSMIKAAEIEIDCIWARIFSVYGKHDKPTTMISTAISKMLKDEETAFTKAEHYWDYLYSEDAGLALYLLGKAGKDQEVYCIGSGCSNPLKYYIHIIWDLIKPQHAPGIGQIPYMDQQVLHLHADIDSLIRDTGFYPRYSFEMGIKETIEFMKKNS